MACSATGTERTDYYLEANGTGIISANDQTKDVCTATKILDRLHREFTEQYVTGTVPTGRTSSSTDVSMNPTFYLRKQPKLNGFQGEDATGGDIYRLNKYLRTTGANDQNYRSAVHAVMNGVYTDNISGTTYLNDVTRQMGFDNSANANNFKGIYGLKKLNEVLEQKITEKVNSMSATTGDSKLLSEVQHYETRQGIKTTLEEIARRENEIYREKFLHIILVVIGIFLVSSQLVQKYFSFGGGGGGGGGFGFGNLFTGFGLGTGSGLFSRFGGLGLGRSGRSRWTSMFSNNPYALSNRR
jgi:hypothetical protein